MLPEKIVKDALKNNCQSIAYTYTEPTIFLEYALDTMKLAKSLISPNEPRISTNRSRKLGTKFEKICEKDSYKLSNIWVSNGYMTKETINLIAPYLDAVNIDLKSFSNNFYQKYCGATLKPVLESLKLLKKKRVHIEITSLIIPNLNDSDKELKQIAKFIFQKLGPAVPWHLTRFFPAYQTQEYPITPIETLIKGRQIGLNIGLKYVYLGNVNNHTGNDTYCPECGTLAIERIGYQVRRLDKNGQCSKCGEGLDIVE